MDESEENMSTEDVRSLDSPFSVKSKPKKRSLVERELETNLTARVTSPVTGEGASTSRYGRARRLKTENDLEAEKIMKPLRIETKTQPQAYKMHASNSPIRKESPIRTASVASSIENQIENIYNENMSLSRFSSTDEAKSQSPAKKFTKVYIRKDLIQKPDTDTVVLIKNLFSPNNKSSHLNNILERSSEKYSLNGHGKRNGFPDTSSVVKALDFDGKKKKKDTKETKEKTVAKNELFELEAGCDYQVGDLAWARVGTYPFWPCIVTREPFTDMFVKKKLFGRVEHDVVHVTFFGDNGRRGWIVDNMLRKFDGRPEFERARAKFTPEAKKKDPRLYAAHFVSEKKLPPWNVSVDEAETLMREPKRLRIDLLHEMLEKARATKTTPKREKSGKITRTDSDVSLSESLYDTLFSEDDAKTDDSKRIKKSGNKSLDVSEVVTACLDNMAAKSGIIKIQKQSHMDRWLQKAKSKTPEKTQPKLLVKTEREKRKDKSKNKQKDTRKPKRNESHSSEKNLLPYQNEHDYSSVNYENHDINDSSNINTDFEESGYKDKVHSNNIEVTAEVESLPNKVEDCNQDDIITTIVSDEIVINDVENVNKVENSEALHDIPELPIENEPDRNITDEESRVSSNGTEQVECKEETPLQNDVLSSVGLQTRRSKRKRHSFVEKIENVDNLTDSSNINTDLEESGLNDNIERNTEVTEKEVNISNDIQKCSHTTTVTGDIIMNDVENVIKVENSEIYNDSLKDSNATNVKSSISSNTTQEIEPKVETIQGNVLSNKTRRSKRKRNSDVEKNKSAVVNKNDSFQINTDFLKNELDDKVECSNIEVAAKVESQSNDITDCSQGNSVATVVSDEFSVGSVENVNKDKSCEVVIDIPKSTNASTPDNSNASNVESSIISDKSEQTESYVESQIQSDVLSNIGLQPRRSKRKRQSDVEKSYSGTDMNIGAIDKNRSTIENHNIKESKLESNDTVVKSDAERTVTDHNIVNSNTDHRENVLDRDKKYAMEQDIDKALKIDQPVVSEGCKKTSKQSREHNLLPLNCPRAVVVIEQLKIDAFQSLTIAKTVKLKEVSDFCKLKEGNNTKNETNIGNPKVDDKGSKNPSALMIVDSHISKTVADSSLGTNIDELSSKNAIVQDANIDNKDIGNDKIQDKALAVPIEEVSNDNSHNDALNVIEDEKMDVDDTDFYHSNEKDQNENAESKSISNELDSCLPTSNLKVETNDVVEPVRIDVANFPSNEGTNKNSEKLDVVIGEETYVFDRTLSQDYDEINSDKAEGTATDPSIEEVVKNDSGCELNNISTNARTESPIYDDIDLEKYDNKIEKSVEKSQSNHVKDDQNGPAHEIDTGAVVNGVAVKDQVFCKVSVHKSKEKLEKEPEDDAPSQLIGDEIIPMLNGDLNKSDETLEKTSKKAEQEELETSNVVKIKEHKKEKRSPKLSLNRSKNHIELGKANDVKINATESPKSIFLENNSKQDEVVSNKALKDDAKDLDFEMLIDMERTKQKIPKINGLVESKESPEKKIKEEDADTASLKSEDSGASIAKRKIRSKEKLGMDDPEFMKYLELRHDALIDEQPELSALSNDEIVTYLYQTWLYEESNKSDRKKTDDAEQFNLVKGLNQDPPPPRKYKKKPKVEKEMNADIRDLMPKDKPKRKATQSKPYYNEEFSDLEEDDLETFSIFDKDTIAQNEDGEEIDEVELYFEKLTKPKPNVFKGYVREKVCEICEKTGNLVKCKSCHGSFHPDCVKKEDQIVELPVPTRGRKKKKKQRGRKPKGYDESLLDSESQSDEKSQDANLSEELNMSVDDDESHITVDAANFEAQLELKMKEIQAEPVDEFESDQEVAWDAPPGQCEIVDVKHKEKPVDYTDFKCHNCEKYDTPVCFVCKSNESPKALTESRQKCQVAHCHRYYHLECLEYWPQTQFNSWEPSKTNKKVIEYVEALSCPRHVCHTCVSDDPRGCKTRFCGDKLARCVKCPATYHSFTKCLPAGTQILTASQIICPRHYEHRAGKVPCHVNTGWCFICALGGTLICCEYCPTSFHAECLNIKPPEGSYMCEDCETGRLPLYGEMVWVKLGHYRWWPGIVLHPAEVPAGILAVRHSPGEFVVRFFGQYDHYWVNRGRVFPFQEGDSGKISSQKSKIDAAFTTAMEHAQRACEILKNVEPNEEEDMDIASSLLPPHYVKLKVNKPVGSLGGRRDPDANSLTQCDCDPAQPDPCGPYSHCLNRMLLTECGPLCRAGERCHNRAFERRLYPRLAAYRTPQRGWGLKTLDDIRQGQFVIEYVGELIDEEEFRRRMARKHEIRDENFYFLTLDKERMIDAGPKGNLARFMNHCCEPNCETQKWTVLGDVRVGLFALRDIPANSEVTFNYNLECAGIEKKRCLCGARRCSGYIGAKPKQEEAQPKKLKVPGKRTYKKRKHADDSPSTSKKPPIKIKIKPIKPRELTEIEKDLLIIKNATSGMSSDSDSRLSSVDEKKDTKALKRKRVSFSTEEVSLKRVKMADGEAE